MTRTAAHLIVAAFVLWALPAASPLLAQEPGVRQYEEQLRVRLDEQNLQKRDTGATGGGWLDFSLFHFDDAVARRDRTLRRIEVRAWAAGNIEGVHRAYVRGLVGWDDWNHGDNGFRGDEDTDPQVERAWYQFDLGQHLKNQTGQEPPLRFKVRAGRDYATIGTAFVLSLPMDMVRVEASGTGWEAMAFLGTPPASTPNIDDSFSVESHQRRCFWGGQFTYTGLDHHRPFVYYLGTDDHTKPRPDVPPQGFDYSPQYVGVGSTGNLVLPTLRYRLEAAYEFGRTMASGERTHRDPICAVGLDAMLEYMFSVPTHPKVMVEYLFGSGDADRVTSATATVGGNAAHTRDQAFNAFGYRNTGWAFSPRISNLHIYSAGAAFHPLEQVECFRRMEVGTTVFFYQKASDSGPISDTTATRKSPWVGWEWDVYCDWRITSDLSWTIRYGFFRPGDAFADDSCRQFLCTAVTLSF
jgi:hypothetical protein